jgi:Ca2+-binding EF-hand superfamily protein
LVALGTIAVHAAPQLAASAAPQKVDKAVPKQQRAIALGEAEVTQLVLLMDVDKNGKISRKEFMDFMSAEFDRLDKDKSGELDVKELSQSRIRPSPPPALGK